MKHDRWSIIEHYMQDSPAARDHPEYAHANLIMAVRKLVHIVREQDGRITELDQEVKSLRKAK